MKKINTKIIIAALAIVFVALLSYLIITLSTQKNYLPENPYIKGNKYDESKLQGDYYLGNINSKVTIIEYSSITCPFCKRYSIDDGTFENIKREYIDTGKVNYVYKHFTRNEVDVLGALAMECAGEQDKFYEYKEIIYLNQSQLQKLEFEKYAKELSLNTSKFNECVKDQRYIQKIAQDKEEAISKGITGTPGFLINGKIVSGAQSYDFFKEIIEKEL